MNHERALICALAGGAVAQEAQAHIDACPGCRAELEALMGVEDRLRAAAPSWAASSRTLSPPPVPFRADRAQRFWSAAAAACLALAFLTAWVGQRPPVGPARMPAFQVVRAGATAIAWPGTEYSTPAVLDAVQEELAASSVSSDDGAASYWSDPSEGEIP